jgi:hypothetical protein
MILPYNVCKKNRKVVVSENPKEELYIWERCARKVKEKEYT